jgi:hypothetical protein
MSKLFDDASLAMIPSAYKDGKLYSIRPTDGSGDFTFTRCNGAADCDLAATRVDVNGLIEKGRENLLQQSNNFSDSDWEKSDVTIASGFEGYDGTNDAWELTRTATAYARMNQSVSQSGVYAHSIYAKAGTLNWISIGPTGGGEGTWFNLSDGTIGIEGSLIKHSSIESVGNGWYRISVVVNNPSNQWFRFYPSDVDGGDESATATGTIYVQDTQLEQGLVATDYIETTTTSVSAGILEDMPRLDYSGGASCPSLLLEPQRLNQVSNSEYYVSYGFQSASISQNETTSPEGLQNAAELIEDSSNDNHFLRIPNLSFISGTDVVFSIYLKENTRRYARLRFDSTGGNTRAWLDLRTGETTFIDATDSGVCTSTNVGNGWFRYEFKVNPSNTGTGSVQVFTQSVESVTGSLQTTYQGDGTSGIYIWGAQVETGSYTTSYIPTYGTSQTRNKDLSVVSYTGMTESQGTLFIDLAEGFNGNDRNSGVASLGLTLNGEGSNQSVGLRGSTDSLQGVIRINSISYYLGAAISGDARHKVCITWTSSQAKIFIDGSLAETEDLVAAPAVFDTTELCEPNRPVLASVNQFLTFPTALTDSECIALTTL